MVVAVYNWCVQQHPFLRLIQVKCILKGARGNSEEAELFNNPASNMAPKTQACVHMCQLAYAQHVQFNIYYALNK